MVRTALSTAMPTIREHGTRAVRRGVAAGTVLAVLLVVAIGGLGFLLGKVT